MATRSRTSLSRPSWRERSSATSRSRSGPCLVTEQFLAEPPPWEEIVAHAAAQHAPPARRSPDRRFRPRRPRRSLRAPSARSRCRRSAFCETRSSSGDRTRLGRNLHRRRLARRSHPHLRRSAVLYSGTTARTVRRSCTRSARCRRPSEEVSAWAVENVELRPGFHELVERFQPVIVSSGLPQLILPVLEREGVEVEVRSNDADPRPDGLGAELLRRSPLPVCGEHVQASRAAGGPSARLRRRRLLRSLRCARLRSRLRSRLPGRVSRRRGRPVRAVRDAARCRCRARTLMAFLALPQPYDFELSTERFRTFGPDLANLWHRRRAAPSGRRASRADRRRAGRCRCRAARRRDPSRRAEAARRRVRARARFASGRRISPCSRRLFPGSPASARLLPGSLRGARHVDHRAAGLVALGARDAQPADRALRRAGRPALCVSDA